MKQLTPQPQIYQHARSCYFWQKASSLFYLTLILILQSVHLMAQTPPEPAHQYGLTYCGFNEEFNNYNHIDIHNTGEEGYNFYIKHFWSPRTVDTTEAVIRNGILTIECNENRSQGDLRSVYRFDDTTFNGWYHDMKTDGAVYFEARIRWDHTRVMEDPDGFPAFWAMPLEHGDQRKDSPYRHYTELDFFEFNPKWRAGEHGFLQGLPPWQRKPNGRWTRYINPIPEQCEREDCVIWPGTPAAINYNVTDQKTREVITASGWNHWQVVGCLILPGDGTKENPAHVISFFNGKKLKDRMDTSWDGDSSWRESYERLSPEETGYAPMPGMRHHRYYVIIGSGQWRTQWDYVRVWQSPKMAE